MRFSLRRKHKLLNWNCLFLYSIKFVNQWVHIMCMYVFEWLCFNMINICLHISLFNVSWYFAASPIEEVTDALSGKGVNFLMTHDIELKMPDMMFDGATFRISPRSIEGNGALVKLELIPKAIAQVKENTGRILFKPFKKISKLSIS